MYHTNWCRISAINRMSVYGCFLKWWVFPPISHPKCWSFLVGKPMGLLGKPTILGNTHVFVVYVFPTWWLNNQPSWKNVQVKLDHFPVKIKNVWNHHPVLVLKSRRTNIPVILDGFGVPLAGFGWSLYLIFSDFWQTFGEFWTLS